MDFDLSNVICLLFLYCEWTFIHNHAPIHLILTIDHCLYKDHNNTFLSNWIWKKNSLELTPLACKKHIVSKYRHEVPFLSMLCVEGRTKMTYTHKYNDCNKNKWIAARSVFCFTLKYFNVFELYHVFQRVFPFRSVLGKNRMKNEQVSRNWPGWFPDSTENKKYTCQDFDRVTFTLHLYSLESYSAGRLCS